MDRVKNFHPIQRTKAHVPGLRNKQAAPKHSIERGRPLTALKDPYSFGAPPRRDPNAPLPHEREQFVEEEEEEEEEEEQEIKKAAPYRVNTTGLSTEGLPQPIRRAATEASGPPLPSRPGASASPSLPARKAPPSLPQRPAAAFPTTDVNLSNNTQEATSRLARAGVSVPGFDLGEERSSSPLPARSIPLPPPQIVKTHTLSIPSSTLPVNTPNAELSQRFSKLKTNSSTDSNVSNSTQTSGTTWAEKQSAMKTAAAFRRDPSNVSLGDAKSAAATANNFHQRHGDQVQAAATTASNFQHKHGHQVQAAYSKWNTVSPSNEQNTPVLQSPARTSDSIPGSPSSGIKKKPPPPVPVKKGNLRAEEFTTPGVPPPIPLSSKPK